MTQSQIQYKLLWSGICELLKAVGSLFAFLCDLGSALIVLPLVAFVIYAIFYFCYLLLTC